MGREFILNAFNEDGAEYCIKTNMQEVVRCKDCKFYWKNSRNADGVVCLATPRDDAFCSEGERNE